MNILLVSSYLPYPLFSGGHIRLYNLIKQLSSKHDITLVCEKRDHQTEHDIKMLKELCKKVITVPRRKQWSLGNILKTGFSLAPFLVVGHTNENMRLEIQKLLDTEKFDLIHAETFYILHNIPTTSVPIVLVEHNIEYLVYKRYADKAPFFVKPFLYFDVFKMKRNEESAWRRVHKLVAVSEEEKKLMGGKDISVIPNGVDTNFFIFNKMNEKRYSSTEKQMILPEKELLFIGDFKWIQNVDTVRWIIQDIWPFLLRALENEMKIKFRVVGRNIPESLMKLNSYDSIVFDNNSQKNTPDIFAEADILLSPIRIGGGTSYKILEAMASGRPVITTSLGIEGIPANDNEEVLIADDVQSIVEKVGRVLRDHELYTSIAKKGRLLIEKEYEWKVIGKKLDEVYTRMIRISSN